MRSRGGWGWGCCAGAPGGKVGGELPSFCQRHFSQPPALGDCEMTKHFVIWNAFCSTNHTFADAFDFCFILPAPKPHSESFNSIGLLDL